jgi:hypothetical protein
LLAFWRDKGMEKRQKVKEQLETVVSEMYEYEQRKDWKTWYKLKEEARKIKDTVTIWKGENYRQD